MIDDVDRLFLRRSVELAARGLYAVAENPRVGCLIVRDGEVVGRGWHQATGGPHAEANALADAGDARGATVYVSLEPCAHVGRQPACTEALIAAGVGRVVAAMEDPDPRVRGRGFCALRQAGIAVDWEALPEAAALNAGFRARVRDRQPLVRLKLAASLDGRTAMASGESQWITSPEARADAQHWRARSSAIVTGIGTVLADDPALTVRGEMLADAESLPEPPDVTSWHLSFLADASAAAGRVRQPLLAIADSRGRTPADAKLFAAERSVLVFTGADAGDVPRAEVLRQPAAQVDVQALLAELAARGCNEVLLEAGPTLTATFLRQGLWQEAIVYLAPKLLGQTARPLAALALDRLADALAGEVIEARQLGPDVRVLLRRGSPHAGSS